MKSLKTISLFITILFASLTTLSCSGDDSSSSGGGSSALGKVNATAGGKNFNSYVASAIKQGTGAAFSIIIQASDQEGNAINLMLHGVDGEAGTFEIDSEGAISATASYTETIVNISNPSATTITTWAAPYEGSNVAGSITITEISETNIKGNFQFKGLNPHGQDTKQISNGSFNLNFQN